MGRSLARVLIILFWLMLALDITFILFDLNEFRFISKLSLFPILFISLILRVPPKKHLPSKFLFALILTSGWVADLIVLLKVEHFYLISLAAYLLMNLLLSFYFLKIKFFVTQHLGVLAFVFSFILTLNIGTITYVWKKVLLDEKLPILFYNVFIAFMCTCAFNVKYSKLMGNVGVQNFIPGIVLFVLSNMVHQINFFIYSNEPILELEVVQIGFYATAFYYFTIGVMRHLKK